MKTFEERYTEWIDGELRGAALVAFEEELARRAQAGEAQAEKVGAESLRALLREHLQAPALSNADFFNHQLRERIEREGAPCRVIRPEVRPDAPAVVPWWSFARFALPGAAAIFIVAALYYGTVPKPAIPSGPAVAAVSHPIPAPAPEVTPDAALPVVAPKTSSGPVEMVKRDDLPEVPNLQAHALDDATFATPFKYSGPKQDQNVQVLWMNGLEYQPEAPTPESSAAPQPAPGGAR